MKYLLTPFWGSVALILALLASCSKETKTADYNTIEQDVLDAWIKENPDPAIAALVDSRQDQGFYIMELDDSDVIGDPIMDIGECWVKYNMTTYDLEGNILSSRNEVTLWQQGTYSVRSRYIPILQFLTFDADDELTYDIPPFLYYALSQKLTVNGAPAYIRIGSKFRVYTPSQYVGSAATAEAGFSGDMTYGGITPMVADVEIVGIVANVQANETFAVEGFASNNGTLDKTIDSNTTTDEDGLESNNAEKEEMQNTWSNAIPEVEDLYIKRTYKPSELFTYNTPYTLTTLPAGASPYEDVDAMNEAIKEAVTDRFGEGVMDGNRILESEAKIWYIGRTLDGFVFDTNIEEVMEIITGSESSSSSSAVSYSSKYDRSDYILAWYYTIPQLRYGQWASFVFSSDYGYGADGASSTALSSGGATTVIPPYTPLIFEIYIEPQWNIE